MLRILAWGEASVVGTKDLISSTSIPYAWTRRGFSPSACSAHFIEVPVQAYVYPAFHLLLFPNLNQR